MNFWDKITGNDINREYEALESRAQRLPDDYQTAWEEIKTNIFPHSDFTGRNLISILDGVLALLEETAADGRSAGEVLGSDIKGFCLAVTGEEGADSYRDRWRGQLNKSIAKKLGE